MTPAGVTRPIIQLFSINMQTLRVWKLAILFGTINYFSLLRICHCGVLHKSLSINRITCTPWHPILRSTVPKTLFWIVLRSWDCHTKHVNPANHLIYCCLVRNDSSWRKIVLTNLVLSILFGAIPNPAPMGLTVRQPTMCEEPDGVCLN